MNSDEENSRNDFAKPKGLKFYLGMNFSKKKGTISNTTINAFIIPNPSPQHWFTLSYSPALQHSQFKSNVENSSPDFAKSKGLKLKLVLKSKIFLEKNFKYFGSNDWLCPTAELNRVGNYQSFTTTLIHFFIQASFTTFAT